MKLGRILGIKVGGRSGMLAAGGRSGLLAAGARSGLLALGVLPALFASACGSSSTTAAASTAPVGEAGIGDGGTGGPSPGTFGALCAKSESQPCTSGVCLLFTPNVQQASGICSMFCSTTGSASESDGGAAAGAGAGACGSTGACVAVASLDGGACFPTCSAAAECAGGLPCVWNQSLDAGLCQPLPLSFCTEIAALGSCEKCLGASCCDRVTACAEDVGCSKLEAACPGNSACASTLQASGEAAAQALGSCAATSCAADCQ